MTSRIIAVLISLLSFAVAALLVNAYRTRDNIRIMQEQLEVLSRNQSRILETIYTMSKVSIDTPTNTQLSKGQIPPLPIAKTRDITFRK
jgi:hypothetical protein